MPIDLELPGHAKLTSRQRARGRPRRIKVGCPRAPFCGQLLRSRRALRSSIGTLIAATVLLAGLPLQAQLSLGVQPMTSEFQVAAGAQQSGTLTLRNDSRTEARLAAQMLDFFVDSSETPQFRERYPAESEFSCRDWLELEPSVAEIGPNTSMPLRFVIHVPGTAKEQSYHCAVGFTASGSAAQVSEIGISVRTITAFYVVVGHPQVAAVIKTLALEDVPGDATKHRGVIVIENNGLMHVRPHGELSVVKAGKVLETVAMFTMPVLPKRSQRFLFPLQTPLPAGEYEVRARVEVVPGKVQQSRTMVRVQR